MLILMDSDDKVPDASTHPERIMPASGESRKKLDFFAAESQKRLQLGITEARPCDMTDLLIHNGLGGSSRVITMIILIDFWILAIPLRSGPRDLTLHQLNPRCQVPLSRLMNLIYYLD
jgi:hypothetical protein